MLKRNEILLSLQETLQRKIQIPNVLVDDVLTLDVKRAPFLVIRTTETQIDAPSSDSWKHTMALEFEILAPNKEVADQLLEQTLLELEIFKAHKQIKGIKAEKIEIAATPLFSLILELDVIFFTPSFRS